MLSRLIFVAGMLAATGASAQELGPMQGGTVSLGDVSGVAYYTPDVLGYRVVATFSSAHGTPMRFIATLEPEQAMTVSVPRGPGEPALEAVFTRRGDRLIVTSGTVGASASAL
ncbi:MAG: hypothetical protein ACREF1_15225, partial [Acetobacteraceae bacterium]